MDCFISRAFNFIDACFPSCCRIEWATYSDFRDMVYYDFLTVSGGSPFRYEINGLQRGQVYYVRVKARNSQGFGGYQTSVPASEVRPCCWAAEYDIASLYMVSFYYFVTKACARRPGAAASVERMRRERRTLLAGAAGELAGATRARQARPSSACTFFGCPCVSACGLYALCSQPPLLKLPRVCSTRINICFSSVCSIRASCRPHPQTHSCT
jgi:hypothetical protein